METSQLSIEALEQIDTICCRFEKELKGSNDYDLRDYLTGTTGLERATLLIELIALDIDYRGRRNEEVSLEDYASLFPDDRPTIERAFSNGQIRLETQSDVATRVPRRQPKNRSSCRRESVGIGS